MATFFRSVKPHLTSLAEMSEDELLVFKDAVDSELALRAGTGEARSPARLPRERSHKESGSVTDQVNAQRLARWEKDIGGDTTGS